ncbi:MAG: tetratricopeptide repeat protein [bacterium]
MLLFLALVLSAAPAQTTGHARILEQSGQLDAALVAYRSALDREPGDPAAYSGLRRLAVRLERHDMLDSVSARLAGLYPERPEFSLGRIEGLLGRELVRDAVAAARTMLERWPSQVLAVTSLFEQQGEFQPATELLVEYRAAAGEPAAGRLLLELHERRQRYGDATRELVNLVGSDARMAVELFPRLRQYGAQPGWRGVLNEVRRFPAGRLRARAEAEVLFGAGREVEMVAAARSGMSRDELYGFAHEVEAAGLLGAALVLYEGMGMRVEQARVLRGLGRVDDALRLLREDGGVQAAFELAQVERLVRKDYAAAARGYADVLRREPGNAGAAWGLASSRLALGDTTAAREALAGVARPSDSLLLLRARLAFYAGADDSLKAHTNQLLARFPTSTHLNDALEFLLLAGAGEAARPLARAMLAHEAGRTDTALTAGRRLAAGKGIAAEHALLYVARVLAEIGQPRSAFELLDSFPTRFPDSPRKARVLFEQVGLAARLADDNLRFRLLEQLLLEYPDSPYAIVGRAVRAEMVRPADPSDLR